MFLGVRERNRSCAWPAQLRSAGRGDLGRVSSGRASGDFPPLLRQQPSAQRAVVTGREGAATVGEEGRASHLGLVSLEALQLASGCWVPEPKRLVLAAGKEPA